MSEPTQPVGHRARRILKACALLLATVVAAEVLLRVFTPETVEVTPPIREQIEAQQNITHSPFVPDHDLGALLAPSRQNRVETPEYRYMLQTDHAGFPNREPWPDSIDIAVLGNSLINGTGVGYERQFTTLLQHELGGRAVLNFSLHGGGSEHYRRIYGRYAAPLRPKLVIAALWLTWEINNSLHFHDWLEENPRPDFTEYRHNYSKSHVSRERRQPSATVPLRDTLRNLAHDSRLLRALHQYSKKQRGIRDPVEQVVLENGETLYLSIQDEQRLMSGWDRPGTPDMREIFFAPLEKLKAAVEADGGGLLVVLVPSKEELYASTDFPEVLRPVEEARKELAARGITTLDLYPVFSTLGAARPAFYRSDPHLNGFGHQIVADALANWIAQERIFGP
jgi:acetyltransferase AlgX (SGNH hydrolase-like protein)